MEDEFYIRLEDKFRGSRELIKDRLRVYLPIINPLKAIFPDNLALDLGCGRGEWLELMRENEWHGMGIDTNKSMINYCKKLELDVIHEDALAYLHSVKSETISVVSGFHIAEHLPFDALLDLVKEAYRILLPSGFLILETPNPENIVVSTANFYLDPTHLHSIPAQLLSFLTEYFGFHRVKILRLQEPQELGSNTTADLLNVLAGVSQDYAIVAQKNAQPEILEIFDKEFEKEYGITLETLAHNYDTQVEETTQHFTSELRDIQTGLNGIRAELDTLGPQHARQQADLNGARIDIQGLRSDLENVRAERYGLQTDLNSAQIYIQSLLSDLEIIRAERDNLQTNLNNSFIDLQGFKKELENLRTQRDELQNRLDEVQVERDGVQNRLYEIQSDREVIKSQLDEMQLKTGAVQEELYHVYTSRSYRITAPMRAVFGIARVWRAKLFRSKKQTATNFYTTANNNSNGTLMGQDPFATQRPIFDNKSIEKTIVESIQFEFTPNRSHVSEEINLDKIMEKIREEVERNKLQIQTTNVVENHYEKETRLFRSVKKVQYIIIKLPFYNQIYNISVKLKPRIPKYQQQAILATDLMKFNDEEFIKSAYKSILKREPDRGGHDHYLAMLRTGSLSKSQILGKLRYSPEGRQVGVKIKGLPFKMFY